MPYWAVLAKLGPNSVEVGTPGFSVDPLSSASTVDLLEGTLGAAIENSLGLKALVLVVTVGRHAGSEGFKIGEAELGKDVLSWGILIFSCKAVSKETKVSHFWRTSTWKAVLTR